MRWELARRGAMRPHLSNKGRTTERERERTSNKREMVRLLTITNIPEKFELLFCDIEKAIFFIGKN